MVFFPTQGNNMYGMEVRGLKWWDALDVDGGMTWTGVFFVEAASK